MIKQMIFLLLIASVGLGGCSQSSKAPLETPDASASPSPTHTETVPMPSADGTTNAPDYLRLIDNPVIPYEPAVVKASVPTYSVASDLSNVVNMDQLPNLTQNQLNVLAKHHFVITPSDSEQLFYIYEENGYKHIPNFITTDSVLQVYHLYYDYSLRNMEAQALLPLTETLTRNMLGALMQLYSSITDETVKAAAESSIAYFVVAAELLNLPCEEEISKASQKLVEQELQLIEAASGVAVSPISGKNVLYENFTVRGHYTRSDNLARYFKAMMFYGLIPFNLFTQTGEPDVESALKAMVITNALFSLTEKDGVKVWENIYSPTSFYVGSSDDLTPYEYYAAMQAAYGKTIAADNLSNPDSLAAFFEHAKNLRQPDIVSKASQISGDIQFRFMGQRYIPDSEIMQNLVEPFLRPIPSGLDVFAAIGNERAKFNIDQYLKPQQVWEEYEKNFGLMRNKFTTLPESTWRSNMYYGWFWTLQALDQPFSNGYPAFMQTDAWKDKSLLTSLGSWAELRHDTILYGKQSAAEMGGNEPPEVKGYVEPNIELYERLLWLTKYSRENLTKRNLYLPGDKMIEKATDFEQMLSFLIDISKKELTNTPLTTEEYYEIYCYGGKLEYLSASIASNENIGKWYEITSETDRNMAIIADVHNALNKITAENVYMEVGVGKAAEIYVLVPIDDEIYITRGAVFDYFEFLSDRKLSDEDWQQMIDEDVIPARRPWAEYFIDTTGIGAEIPYPTLEY